MQDLKVIENELVPVYETDTGEKVVNGRELYAVIGSKQKFVDWVQTRLTDCDAIEEKDFVIILGRSDSGRNTKEFTIKLDTAKEMAMLERNDKGKKVRRYFIEVEKRHQLQISTAVTPTIEKPTAEHLKLIEIVANAPIHTIEAVTALAKPFMQAEVSKAPIHRDPTMQKTRPAPITLQSEPDKRSAAGYAVPFNHKRLARHLKSIGVSSPVFARQCGIEVASMRKYVTGKTRPGEETRYKMCQQLDKPINWLDG